MLEGMLLSSLAVHVELSGSCHDLGLLDLDPGKNE